MSLTARHLKAAVISYFRFKRQYVAVDECQSADVLCDNGKQLIEIEVKITRSDLIFGERRKGRHPIGSPTEYYITPNLFYLCTPDTLRGAAMKWIEETHPSYGLLTLDDEDARIFSQKPPVLWGHYLMHVRPAKKLHREYRSSHFRMLAMRASAANCAHLGRSLQNIALAPTQDLPHE